MRTAIQFSVRKMNVMKTDDSSSLVHGFIDEKVVYIDLEIVPLRPYVKELPVV